MALGNSRKCLFFNFVNFLGNAMASIKTISKLNQTKLTLKTPITGASPKFAQSPDPQSQTPKKIMDIFLN